MPKIFKPAKNPSDFATEKEVAKEEESEKFIDTRFAYNYYNQATGETIAVDVIKQNINGLYKVQQQKTCVKDYLDMLNGKNFEAWNVPASRLQELKEPCINKKFSFFNTYTKNVLLKKGSKSLLCVGDGGNGKSYTYLNAIKELKLIEGVDYIILKTDITSAGLFDIISANSNKIIICDDVAGLLQDRRCISLLKSAMDTSSNLVQRIMSGIAKTCVFTGRFIIVDNATLEDIEDEAFLTRPLIVSVRMTLQEKLARINTLYKTMALGDAQYDEDGNETSPAPDLSEEDRDLVWKTYLQLIHEGILPDEKVSVRGMLNALCIYETDKDLESLVYQLSMQKPKSTTAKKKKYVKK